MTTVTARVTGDKQLARTLEAFARDFPKQASQALRKTADRSVTRTRRGISDAINLRAQKTIKNRVQRFRHGAKGLRYSVWVGTSAGVEAAQIKGVGGKRQRRTIADVLPNAKTYFAQVPSGESVEYMRTRRYARPILDRVAREQMREYYPGELKRLVLRTINRRARRKR